MVALRERHDDAVSIDELESESVSECPGCGSSRSAIWLYGHDRLHGISPERRFPFVRCRDCGICFQSMRPTPTAIGRYYPEAYAPHAATPAQATKVQRSRWELRLLARAAAIGGDAKAQARIARIYRKVSSATTLLDFGCGAGSFLDIARRRGARTIGMDMSVRALEQIKQRSHEAIEVSDAGWLRAATMGINFVRMNHVVEHLYDPKATLSQIRNILSENGVLHIAVPNPSGISARLFRSRWHGLDCPRHIVLYPPRTLVRMLDNLNFRKIKVIPEPTMKDFARSLGYVLRDFGIWQHREIDSLINLPYLNLACALPVGLGRLLGMPDRFHIVARK